QQSILRLEVVEDQAGAYTDPLGDVGDPGVSDPPFGDHGRRRVENLTPTDVGQLGARTHPPSLPLTAILNRRSGIEGSWPPPSYLTRCRPCSPPGRWPSSEPAPVDPAWATASCSNCSRAPSLGASTRSTRTTPKSKAWSPSALWPNWVSRPTW